MSLAKQEFTNSGRSMLGRAQAGEVLHISQIVVGSGGKSVPSDLWPMTVLAVQEMAVVISATRDYGQGTLLVEGSFRSDTAPHAFYLREVGVLAHIGVEADRLYSVANVFADPPDYIDPAAPTMQVFKIKLVIDRIPTANVIVQIGPSESVIGSNIGADTVGPGVYKSAAGNVLSFKRIVEGAGMDIHDSTDGNSIYIGTSVLLNSVDLYVPLSYPGAPAGSLYFATIQAAHDYLLSFTIPPDKYATIHVYKGTFVQAATININHPNSQQIGIIGQPRDDRGASAITFVTGPPQAKTVVVPSNTNLVSGLYVWLADCAVPWMGGCKITNVAGTTISLTTVRRDGQPTYNTNQLGAGRRLSFLPTQIQNNTDTPIVCSNGIRFLQNLCFIGPGSVAGTFGCFLGGPSKMSDCMVIHCSTGISCFNGGLQLTGECVISDCDFGIVTSDGTVAAYITIVNGCNQGILPVGGLSLAGYGPGLSAAAAYITHCIVGINAAGGRMSAGGISYAWNDTGIQASLGGVFQIGVNWGCTPLGNGLDLSASGMSYIFYNAQGILPVVTSSPADDVIGNQNSLIHIV
jgi:hypothetical protein